MTAINAAIGELATRITLEHLDLVQLLEEMARQPAGTGEWLLSRLWSEAFGRATVQRRVNTTVGIVEAAIKGREEFFRVTETGQDPGMAPDWVLSCDRKTLELRSRRDNDAARARQARQAAVKLERSWKGLWKAERVRAEKRIAWLNRQARALELAVRQGDKLAAAKAQTVCEVAGVADRGLAELRNGAKEDLRELKQHQGRLLRLWDEVAAWVLGVPAEAIQGGEQRLAAEIELYLQSSVWRRSRTQERRERRS
jgi:hypothetical protein